MLVYDVIDLTRIRHSSNSYFNATAASSRNVNGSNTKNALEKTLVDPHITNVRVIDLVRVLGKDALA